MTIRKLLVGIRELTESVRSCGCRNKLCETCRMNLDRLDKRTWDVENLLVGERDRADASSRSSATLRNSRREGLDSDNHTKAVLERGAARALSILLDGSAAPPDGFPAARGSPMYVYVAQDVVLELIELVETCQWERASAILRTMADSPPPERPKTDVRRASKEEGYRYALFNIAHISDVCELKDAKAEARRALGVDLPKHCVAKGPECEEPDGSCRQCPVDLDAPRIVDVGGGAKTIAAGAPGATKRVLDVLKEGLPDVPPKTERVVTREGETTSVMGRFVSEERWAKIKALKDFAEVKLRHVNDCVAVWNDSGVGRPRTIVRTVEELRRLIEEAIP